MSAVQQCQHKGETKDLGWGAAHRLHVTSVCSVSRRCLCRGRGTRAVVRGQGLAARLGGQGLALVPEGWPAGDTGSGGACEVGRGCAWQVTKPPGDGQGVGTDEL